MAVLIPRGKLAVRILKALADSRSETGLTSRPLRWSELKERLGFRGSHGTLRKALAALERERLVRKRQQAYELTFEGRWALHHGPAEPPPELPPDAKTLMEIHGHAEPTPTQLEFFQRPDLQDLRRNLCVFAAAGQGKTLLAEVLMLRALRAGKRVLYLTTHKLDNRDRHELLREVFSRFGYSVERVDSDTPTPPERLRKARIVVSTYERALGGLKPSERWSAGRKLVVAEGLHLLGDPWRGPSVDLLLTELKHRARVVALSVRVGNEAELAEWLSARLFASPHTWPRREALAIIRDPYAGTRTRQHVLVERPGEPRAELRLRGRWYPVLAENLPKPVLFLTASRPDAERIARHLPGPTRTRVRLPPELERTSLTDELGKLMSRGVAYHHAGVPRALRILIETSVSTGRVQAVATTGTVGRGALPFASIVVCLDHFERIGRPLGRVEYEALVGQARYGREPVSVVVAVREEKSGRELLSSGLEPVLPPTLDRLDQILENLVVATVGKRGAVQESELAAEVERFIESTAAWRCSSQRPDPMKAIKLTISKLEKDGYLSRADGKIRLTERGRVLLELGVSSAEEKLMRKRLGELGEATEDGLLELVCDLLWPETCERKTWKRVLKQWIEEIPLREIAGNRKRIHDTDVESSARDAASVAEQVAQLAELLGQKETAKCARVLARRLRHGVKADLLGSDLLDLKHINRVAARKLFEAGFKSTFHIYHSMPFGKPERAGKLASKARIPRELAEVIQREVWEKRKERRWLRRYQRWARRVR